MLVALVLSSDIVALDSRRCLPTRLVNQIVLGDAFRRRGGARSFRAVPQQNSSSFRSSEFCILMWATVPLSIGGSKQFDAGKLLMYPITLRKLFAVDFISELTTLHSVFAVPAVLAICIGAGLGSGNLTPALIAAFPAILFGVALSKWLSTIIGSLVRRKRATRRNYRRADRRCRGFRSRGSGSSRADSLQARRFNSIVALDTTGSRAFLLVGERCGQHVCICGRVFHAYCLRDCSDSCDLLDRSSRRAWS